MLGSILFAALVAIVGGTEAGRKRLLTLSLVTGGALGGSAAASVALYSCQGCTPIVEPAPSPTAAPPEPAPPPVVPDASPPTLPPLDAAPPPPPPPVVKCEFKKPKTARSAKPLPQPYIVGGSDALSGEFLFAASMQTTAGSHFCGGTVFRKNWVLTAAHCVESFSVFKVVVGRLDLRTVEGLEYKVNANGVRIHPGWGTNPKADLDYDVALVRLPESATVPSIDLHVGPTTGDAYAIGWGRTSSGGPLAPNLQKVRMPIVDQAVCRGYYQESLTDRMICSDRAGQGSCQGDSGGALLFQVSIGGKLVWQEAGDVSWGTDCATLWPGVYGRLTSPVNGPQAELATWAYACAED